MLRKHHYLLAVCLVVGWAVASSAQGLNCTITGSQTCLQDNVNGQQLLEFAAVYGSITTNSLMSLELCASMCTRYNYSIMGVEQGYQCFCGNSYAYNPTSVSLGQCNSPCTLNNTEMCGATNRLLVFSATCEGTIAPTGHACLDAYSQSLPFCNTSLSTTERVEDLVSRLTLTEKLGLLGPDTVGTNVDPCTCMVDGVPRLGIPNYEQLVEVNTAVAATCFAPDKCATVFPGPGGLAATFNRSLWVLKGNAISDEVRAFNNLNWYRTLVLPFARMGLQGFGPNINIVRDPRFGRNSELPSEDPYLSGTYAIEYLAGMQGFLDPDPRYLKMIPGLKHFACYSVETNRFAFDANVSTFDLFDTYLAQFEIAFTRTNFTAPAIMCSYASVNGVPSCANNYFLNDILRKRWGQVDIQVVTDCLAISNMVDANHYASNNTDAAAKAILGGADINLGDSFYPPVANGGNGALPTAISIGRVNESTVDDSVTRALTKRFRVGIFDPLEGQKYTQIGAEAINSTATQQLNLEAALQSFVLLKNANNTLPFVEGKKLAVVGPHVYSTRDLMEDYAGDMRCFGGDESCIPTIAAVFTAMHTGPTTVVKGVDLDDTNATDIPAALAAVEEADYVVLCIGIGYNQEHEGIDRTNITLPGLQDMFAQKVLAVGKPTVIVLINGGIVAIDNLVQPAHAIIEAFYPSVAGAHALYLTIFGYENRFGRLPVTIYPADFIVQQSLFDFDMTSPPGRTYRYYTETPLFPFGWGLSYTSFNLSCFEQTLQNETIVVVSVENIGKMDGDEVIMVFHRVSGNITKSVNHPVPFRALVEFDRVSLAAGEVTKLEFSLPWAESLALTDESGNKVLYAGTHYLDFTDSQSTCTVTVQVP